MKKKTEPDAEALRIELTGRFRGVTLEINNAGDEISIGTGPHAGRVILKTAASELTVQAANDIKVEIAGIKKAGPQPL